MLRFNPRVLAGGRDKAFLHDASSYAFQSTRPRGRTRLAALFEALPHKGCFNPRVLAGGRDEYPAGLPEEVQFQSTRPRGRTRRSPPQITRSPAGFNPRVLAGGRDLHRLKN